MRMCASPLSALTTSYGHVSRWRWTSSSSYLRPMSRFAAETVFSALVIACRRAAWPTRRSPLCANPITDGVVREPSEFAITTGASPSMTATHEFVVPRSIPTTRLIDRSFHRLHRGGLGDHDERRAEQPLGRAVSALQHLDHRARRLIALGLRDRLVKVRIERLPRRLDRRDVEPLERRHELAQHELHALDDRALPRLLGRVLDRALEVVD